MPLSQQTVQTNVVMIGSANEVHLAAFREHPEFPSFRGRFELLRAPYLRSYLDEKTIYDTQILPFVTRHVAPHATRVAAQFAVLTRMRQPEAKRYPDALAPIVSLLTAVEKMELFATGNPPERLDADAQKVLRAGIRNIYEETASNVDFEGRTGVCPREIRTVLFDAAQSTDHACLSPFAVLNELDELCRRTSEFDWLKEKQLAGGYHDHRLFRDVARSRLLDTIEDEMRAASGLVDEVRYGELFERYISHVSLWVKGEKIRNPHTGADENPDERMMQRDRGPPRHQAEARGPPPRPHLHRRRLGHRPPRAEDRQLRRLPPADEAPPGDVLRRPPQGRGPGRARSGEPPARHPQAGLRLQRPPRGGAQARPQRLRAAPGHGLLRELRARRGQRRPPGALRRAGHLTC